MSRRPKSSQTVALFPFLAVLVCTMGSLIFLLLVTTRMIRDRATAEATAAANPAPQLPVLSITTPESPTVPELPPTIALEPEPPAEPTIDVRAVAMAQRQRELDALTAQWQGRVNELDTARDERARLLAQRQQLQKGAAKRVASMQLELHDMEVKLGQMTGELSVPSTGGGTAQERVELETQIKELKRRLRAAQNSSNEDKFEVVPFDIITGTSRRPILIECTSTGLKFIPEDITVKPDDLMGFTPQVNPLIVGASALVNYWTAWNIRQPNPSREPEPYVLLLVRPSGTISYYVAMKMLSDLKQAHGYELIEEDTVLQIPPVDAGAKAALEAAVKRLLSERNQVLKQAGSGGFGTGRGRYGSGRGGPGGIGGEAVGGAGGGRPNNRPAGGEPAGGGPGEPAGGGNEFLLSDIVEKGSTGDAEWNRVENFEGSRRGSNGGGGSGRTNGQAAGNQTAANQATNATGRGGARAVSGDGTGSAGRMVTASAAGPAGGAAAKPGTVPSTAASGSSEDSEIEDLSGEGDQRADAQNAGASGQQVDTGLGSSGKRAIPVQDLRTTKKHKRSDGEVPTEPEHLAGRHWGISEPGAAIGLEREVRIDVEKNRYIISEKHGVPLIDTDSREDSFVKMITVIDLQARDWGKPPQGFFWKPSLRFVVADGADANYERVQSLFERAGISTSREYPHDHPPDATPAAKPVTPTPTPTYTPAPAAPKPSRRLFPGIMR